MTWRPPIVLDYLGATQLRICRAVLDRIADGDDEPRTATEIAWHVSAGAKPHESGYLSPESVRSAMRGLESRRIFERARPPWAGITRGRVVAWRMTDEGVEAFASDT